MLPNLQQKEHFHDQVSLTSYKRILPEILSACWYMEYSDKESCFQPSNSEMHLTMEPLFGQTFLDILGVGNTGLDIPVTSRPRSRSSSYSDHSFASQVNVNLMDSTGQALSGHQDRYKEESV